MKKVLYILIIYFLFVTLAASQTFYSKRELRGTWIATVANIDWPSDKSASSGEKIKELVTIFDKLEECKINTVFFQIRTECDALYDSRIEPWSYWLTGDQGKAPVPFFDPLEFAISEAHTRGIELHVWFNPYRAVKTEGEYINSSNHITKTHPDWVLQFGKYKMLNPGLPDVSNYIIKIVVDVLKRYDVDGIHFDDYFYPYSPKVTNEDAETFAKHKGNFKNIDDWRRNNINNLMAKINDTIKVIKPKVKFGISPFAIIENKYAGTRGLEAYHTLYCDPLTWIKNNTVDYLVPQLYWEIGHARADYSKLLPWWASVVKGCHLYIGLFSSQIAAPDYKGSQYELNNQLEMNHKYGNVTGEVYFSAKSITQNYSGLLDSLKKLYKYPALPPVMLWKDNILPNPPKNLNAVKDSSGILLFWKAPEKAIDGETASRYVIYRFNSGSEIEINNPEFILHITPDNITSYKDYSVSADIDYIYVVTSLDELNNESEGLIKTEVK